MIPIWVEIVTLFICIGILVWERLDYKKLYGYVETLEHFLDMYISQYGTLPGITEIPDEDVNGNNIK